MTYSAYRLVYRAVAICCLILAAGTAEAAVYKCIDTSGNTSYSQTACPGGEAIKAIKSQSSAIPSSNCRISRNFAWQTAQSMHNGLTSGQIFDQYGGIDALSPTSIALINYVYTYKHNYKTSAARITELAVRRCAVGSFGPTECDQFPVRFIDELGGCQGSGIFQTNSQQMASASNVDDQQSDTVSVQSGASQPADIGTAPSLRHDTESAAECRERVRVSIDNVYMQIRHSHSIDEQDSLREEKHELGKEMRRC